MATVHGERLTRAFHCCRVSCFLSGALLLYALSAQASVNIRRWLRGDALYRNPHDFTHGEAAFPTLLCISLGRYDGLVVFNDFTVTGVVAAAMKWFIEYSKVEQYTGHAWANWLWHIADPASIALNRVYQQVKRQLTRCRRCKHK